MIGFLASVFPGFSQFLTPQSSSWMCEHVLYLEVMGTGGTASLNYEQLIASGEFFAVTSRFGAGVWPEGAGTLQFGVPVTASFLAGNEKIWGELGGGVRVSFTQALMEEGAEIWPAGMAGIRYHPDSHGGLMLRLAYTPSLSPAGEYVHGAGLSIGIGLSRR